MILLFTIIAIIILLQLLLKPTNVTNILTCKMSKQFVVSHQMWMGLNVRWFIHVGCLQHCIVYWIGIMFRLPVQLEKLSFIKLPDQYSQVYGIMFSSIFALAFVSLCKPSFAHIFYYQNNMLLQRLTTGSLNDIGQVSRHFQQQLIVLHIS